MNCKYSQANEPCVIRNPDKDDCRACLIAKAEREMLQLKVNGILKGWDQAEQFSKELETQLAIRK